MDELVYVDPCYIISVSPNFVDHRKKYLGGTGMQVTTGDIHIIQKSASLKTHHMGAGDPVVIFDMLCNRTYQHPLRAVAQEYALNAMDAHREVGTPDRPVEIILPTDLDPTFYVRDFGLGITPDRMADIFVNIGNSTKRATGEHGGWGIGGKVGFAYGDTFVLISRTADRVSRQYLAYRGSDNLGHIDLLDEQPMEPDDETGLTVCISIRESDKKRLWLALCKCCFFWETRPIIKNPPDDTLDTPPITLPSGVSVLDYPVYQKISDILDLSHTVPLIVVDGVIYEALGDVPGLDVKNLIPRVAISVGVNEVDVAMKASSTPIGP